MVLANALVGGVKEHSSIDSKGMLEHREEMRPLFHPDPDMPDLLDGPHL